MGFIRGALITIFAIVFFFSLLAMNFCLAISLSLNHETIKPAVKITVVELMTDFSQKGELFTAQEKEDMSNYCMADSQYTLSYENYNLVVPCEVIEQGEDSIVNYVSDNLVDQVYYTEYECEFWDCVRNSQMPLVLISEKAKEYWNGKFLLLSGLSLLLFFVIFLIAKKRPAKFITAGVLIILAAFPFRNLDWISRFVSQWKFSGILSVFFTQAHTVFLLMIVFGVLFIVLGILCLIFGWKLRFKEDEGEQQLKSNLQKKKKK